MPRFFFNIFDGRTYLDTDGVELPSWRDAQIEAIAAAGRIIADNAALMKLGEDWVMEVTDPTGLILLRLEFHVAAAPAIGAEHSKTPRGTVSG